MKLFKHKILYFFLFLATAMTAQNVDQQIDALNSELAKLELQKIQILDELEELKFQRINRDLKAVGLPSTNFIEHSAMILEYNEGHEQAAWVAHVITADIINGSATRSNDFRIDPKVSTGTAVEEDYFLKFLQEDSSYTYDGFGYDRGHLAPSADFRWSAKALSESYFYSNMSPQLAKFNREKWAELESMLRGYVYDHPGVQLMVVTAPVLKEGLPVIERSINKVSIPEQYVKVAIDLTNKRGIAFIMPNQKLTYPLETFAVNIDKAEELTGYDFFNLLDEALETNLESTIDKKAWFPDIKKGDAEPIYPPSLPPAHFNTVQSKRYVGKGTEITVCGTVVSTRLSRKGNLWMNIDKQFPNQIFSVYIKKEDLVNFTFDPEKEYANKQVCFDGKIQDFNGTPTVRIGREGACRFLSEAIKIAD